MKPRLFATWFLLLGAATFSGCATVRPWERDHLARYGMRADRDRLALGINEHLWFSREAVHGGRSVGGGGCGCN
jgi:hypothetical protein